MCGLYQRENSYSERRMAAQNVNVPNQVQLNPLPMLQIPPRPHGPGVQRQLPNSLSLPQEYTPSDSDTLIDPISFKVVIMQCTAALHQGVASVTLDRQQGPWTFLPKVFVSSAVSASSSCPIQHLILKHHHLDQLPDNFSSPATMLPSSLTILDLSNNCFVSVPKVVCTLTSLSELHLNNNKITFIPDLSSLIHLQVLQLQYNHLEELPVGVCGLPSLRQLNVEHNQIATFPEEVGQLTTLQVLYASFNKIKCLPISMTKLSNLEELYLTQNQLERLPDRLDGWSSLCQLHIANNKLVFLPLSFINLKNLKAFTVSGNSLKFPPISACRNGVNSLKSFMESKYQSERWNSTDGSCNICNNLYFESDSGDETPFEDI